MKDQRCPSRCPICAQQCLADIGHLDHTDARRQCSCWSEHTWLAKIVAVINNDLNSAITIADKLESAIPGIVIPQLYLNGEEILDVFDRFNPGDIYIIGFNLDAINGVTLTQKILQRQPDAIVIGFSQDDHRQEFLAAGAKAFVNRLDEGLDYLCIVITQLISSTVVQKDG